MVVTSHRVEYHRAITYAPDGVRIELATGSVGASRFEVVYDVFQGEARVAHARTGLCAFDFTRHQPTRLDPQTRERLLAAQQTTEPLRELAAPALDGVGETIEIPVRWTDLDRYSHVNNAVVADYVQQGRIELTTSWDPTMARAGAEGSQHLWLVARQDLYYLRQLGHGVVTVRCAPTRIGSSSIVLTAEVEQEGAVAARAATVLVCADLDGKPTPLPERTRSALAARLVATDD